MAVINDLNMVSILKNTLEKEVKKAITEAIVKEELQSYEDKIRKKISLIVEEISFKHIERVKDFIHMRDELHVFLHTEENNKDIIRKL